MDTVAIVERLLNTISAPAIPKYADGIVPVADLHDLVIEQDE